SRQAPVFVDPVPFCALVVEAVRGIVRALPPGLAGDVVADLAEQEPPAATVLVTFRPRVGTLPFPQSWGDLAGHLLACRGTAQAGRVRQHATGIVLVSPATAFPAGAEARL